MGELHDLNARRAQAPDGLSQAPAELPLTDPAANGGIVSFDRSFGGSMAVAERAMPGLMDSVDNLREMEASHTKLAAFLEDPSSPGNEEFAGMCTVEAKTELARLAAEIAEARISRRRLFDDTYLMIDLADADGHDPVGHLTAALNVQYPGYGIGDKSGSSLRYLIQAAQTGEIPIAVIGSSHHGVSFGNYADLPLVQRSGSDDFIFDNSSRLRLLLRLANLSGFAHPDDSKRPYTAWNYEGSGVEDVEVRQLLRILKITDRQSEVLEAAAYGRPTISSRVLVDNSLKEHLLKRTGFPRQAVVFGRSAVKGTLTYLHSQAEIDTNLEHLGKPSRDEVLAGGLSIGIGPSEISTGVIDFRRRLAGHFMGSLTSSIVARLRVENARRSGFQEIANIGWSILASPQVYRYLGMSEGDLATAAVNGLAIFNRLLQGGGRGPSYGLGGDYLGKSDAARSTAQLIAMRYAVELDISQFSAEQSTLPSVDESLGAEPQPGTVVNITSATKRRDRQ